jgi:two-component system chemotaxis response regulator CheY
MELQPPTMTKKIIVIDDSKTVRDQVRSVLEQAGYSVVEAADGEEGLEKIRGQPDLAMAICDVNMPNLGGIGMVEALKADGLIATLPVVMLTTEGQPALIQRAKQAGAKGWIVKPFKPEHLLAAVAKVARNV